MSKACLVRGSINIDEFFDLPHIVKPGETIASTSYTRKVGGKGANQAYAAGRAGARVVLDAQVGPDGVDAVAQIESGGVDVSRVRQVDDVTGRAIIQRAKDGENSIVLHAGANFVNPGQEPDLKGFTHLLLQNEIPLEDTLAYLGAAGALGLTTIYNPSPMPAASELAVFPWDCLTHLIVNEGELAAILSAFTPSEVAASKDQVAATAKKQMKELSAISGFGKLVIVTTIGADGVIVLKDGEMSSFPAAKTNGVVDTTGAGDTFAGYFVAMLMERGDDAKIDEIVPTCLQACAVTVETAGAMESIPSRADVDARLKK